MEGRTDPRFISMLLEVRLLPLKPGKYNTYVRAGRQAPQISFLLDPFCFFFLPSCSSEQRTQTNGYSSKMLPKSWLVWLSGLSVGLQTKELLVRFPGWGTCLGCGPGPQERTRKRQPHTDVSLPLFLPLFPSLKINKSNL